MATNNKAKWMRNNPEKRIHDLFSPTSGKVYSLSTINDRVFSTGFVGDGLVIDSTDGTIRAPFTGKMVVTTPFKHAYGIMADNGCAVLIHIGVDTVKLEAKGLKSFVKKDQYVNKGDLLAKFDAKYIRSQKLDPRIIVLVTRDSKYPVFRKTNKNNVNVGELLLELK